MEWEHLTKRVDAFRRRRARETEIEMGRLCEERFGGIGSGVRDGDWLV